MTEVLGYMRGHPIAKETTLVLKIYVLLRSRNILSATRIPKKVKNHVNKGSPSRLTYNNIFVKASGIMNNFLTDLARSVPLLYATLKSYFALLFSGYIIR